MRETCAAGEGERGAPRRVRVSARRVRRNPQRRGRRQEATASTGSTRSSRTRPSCRRRSRWRCSCGTCGPQRLRCHVLHEEPPSPLGSPTPPPSQPQDFWAPGATSPELPSPLDSGTPPPSQPQDFWAPGATSPEPPSPLDSGTLPSPAHRPPPPQLGVLQALGLAPQVEDPPRDHHEELGLDGLLLGRPATQTVRKRSIFELDEKPGHRRERAGWPSRLLPSAARPWWRRAPSSR